MSYISSLDSHEVDALRDHLLDDFEEFSKFCFKIMTGQRMLHVDYYVVLFHAVQKLIDLESNRMIMNIPPRAGKTLIVSIFLPLFAWCRNPCGQTILTGFNSDVLAECSGYIRTIMSDPDFQRVFPDVIIDNNKKSVERLGTMSAGVIHAIPTSGKMTGKGCGALVEDFAGLMCIDDVIKPDDAASPTERNKINNRFSNTLLSRLATETTPLCIIMQRLDQNDLCGYLMTGGTSDVYDWLNIPGLIRKESGSQEWYDKQIEKHGYTHVRPILYDLGRPDEAFDEEGDSSFWDIRKTVKTLKGLRDKDSYTFYSQYMGEPVGKGSVALGDDDVGFYVDAKDFRIAYTFMTADTASTTQTYSDYTVACLWAVTKCKKLLLLDATRDKWEVPELIEAMRDYWKKHNIFDLMNPTLKPRGFYIEDKSSGLFLNQQFTKDSTVAVKPVPRDGTATNDKFSRFMNTISYFSEGRILLPKTHPLYLTLRRELLGNSNLGNTTGHDDFCDNCSDAVAVAFANEKMSYADWA